MAVRKGTRMEYAIKFFLSIEAFYKEEQMYRSSAAGHSAAFARFLPKVGCFLHSCYTLEPL